MTRTPILAVVLALAVAGCAQPAGEPSPSDGLAWSFTDIDGVRHAHDAPASNATVLFFMATWCGTCRAKSPMLAQVHEDYGGRGVRFYSLDVDPTETPEQLRAWSARHAHEWPHAIDQAATLQRAFGVTSQSSVVGLDARGDVVRTWGYGAVNDMELREALERALAAPAATAA